MTISTGGGVGRWGVVPRNLGVAFAFACFSTAGPAAALPPPEDNWEFDLALYGWITDMTGEGTIGDVTVDIDPQLWNDIISNLDMAFMGGLEARYQNRWILNLDLTYAKLSTDDEIGPVSVGFGPKTFERDLGSRNTTIALDTAVGNLEIPARFDPGTLRVDIPRVETTLGPFDIDTTLTQFITRGFLGYRLFDVPLFEQADPRRFRFDLIGGFRYYHMKMEIDIESPPVRVPDFEVTASLSGGSVRVGGDRLPGRTMNLGRVDLGSAKFSGTTLAGTDIDEEKSAWWVDPIVGARIGVDVSEKVSLMLMGNVGGFGIGSASDFSWETVAIGNYRFGESWSFIAGYRALGFDREGSDLALDLILHGPVVGFIKRF